MVLLSLPCPPMPIVCTRELGGGSEVTDGDYHRGNSHDLLANMMNVRTVQSDEDHNSLRKAAQVLCYDALISKMDDWVEQNGKREIPPDGVIYELFSIFFREYIQTYVDNGTRTAAQSDVRVYGMDTVLGDSDPVLRAARGFAKAQDTLFGEIPQDVYSRRADIDEMTYPEILRLCAARIVFSQ